MSRVSLSERLRGEADLCRAETADDIAKLLDEAAARVDFLEAKVGTFEELSRFRRELRSLGG